MPQKDELLVIGEILKDEFVVNRLMATGGYAIVYDAERLDNAAPVVVKALRLGATEMDPQAVERFHREAKIAAHLSHPNIVKILDYGQTVDEVLFIVLERLDGYPLSQIIYQERTPHEHVRRILMQVLSAIAHAHGRGIVHRDIKPSNVYVCELETKGAADNEYRVKVLDFGLSKGFWGNRDTFCRPLTMAGEVVGTPGYLAPEMLHDMALATPQVDLYAVGLLGYEMLTGTEAYTGTGIERAKAQLTQDPKPPPEDIEQLPIFRIIKHLIERDPTDRYLSAAEALQDLEELGR